MSEADRKIMIPAIAEDETLYPVEKLEAHRQGVLHLAISVFVCDGDRVLLQQRAAEKYHCPGLWANACCTHPHWGETPDAAAPRRLREELGIALPLTRRGVVDYRADVGGGLTEHERVHLYLARTEESRLALAPNPDEVSATRWIGYRELVAEIDAQPELFTPWMRIYMAHHADLIFDAAA